VRLEFVGVLICVNQQTRHRRETCLTSGGKSMSSREQLEARWLPRCHEKRLQQPHFTNGCDEVRDICLDLRANNLIDWNLTNRLNRRIAH
jgi:hypothetical protein